VNLKTATVAEKGNDVMNTNSNDNEIRCNPVMQAKIVDKGYGLPNVGDSVSDGGSSAIAWRVIGGMINIGTGAKIDYVFANVVRAAEWPSSGLSEHFICEVELRGPIHEKKMEIDLSLKNGNLYHACGITEVAGRLNLETPVEVAINIVGHNIERMMQRAMTDGTARDEVTLTGPMAVWSYLVVFHAVLHRFDRVYYDDGRNGPVLVAQHGPGKKKK